MQGWLRRPSGPIQEGLIPPVGCQSNPRASSSGMGPTDRQAWATHSPMDRPAGASAVEESSENETMGRFGNAEFRPRSTRGAAARRSRGRESSPLHSVSGIRRPGRDRIQQPRDGVSSPKSSPPNAMRAPALRRTSAMTRSRTRPESLRRKRAPRATRSCAAWVAPRQPMPARRIPKSRAVGDGRPPTRRRSCRGADRAGVRPIQCRTRSRPGRVRSDVRRRRGDLWLLVGSIARSPPTSSIRNCFVLRHPFDISGIDWDRAGSFHDGQESRSIAARSDLRCARLD